MVDRAPQPRAGRPRRERAGALGVGRAEHPARSTCCCWSTPATRPTLTRSWTSWRRAPQRAGLSRAAPAGDARHRPARALRLPRRHLAAASRGSRAGPPDDDRPRRRVRAGLPERLRPVHGRPLVAAGDDPAGLLPARRRGQRRPDLGRNGSYLVLRQLAQDVPGFWRFVDRRRGGRRHERPGRRLARRQDGRPLAERRAAGARARRRRPDMAAAALNDFRYHDADAARPPLPGRRARPPHQPARLARSRARAATDSVAVNHRHRLLRRGREYGPR